MKRLEEPELNRQIVLLFLQKIELLTPAERKIISTTIDIINHPIFVTGKVASTAFEWNKEESQTKN